MVDDKLGGSEGIHALGVAAKLDDGLAHRGKIDDARHAGEVLQDDPRGREGDLMRGHGGGVPGQQGLDVALSDIDAILKAQQILKQNLQRIGQAHEALLR